MELSSIVFKSKLITGPDKSPSSGVNMGSKTPGNRMFSMWFVFRRNPDM